jgi:hypothetical protein
MDLVLDDQHPLRTYVIDEESSRDSEHREVPYSLARGKEKCDRKAPESYRFEDMISFALTRGGEDSSSVQNGMPKEKKSL